MLNRKPDADHQQKATKSLNDGGLITDWESFERYNWPDIENLLAMISAAHDFSS